MQARIRDAAARRAPLVLRGGGTKDFYGNPVRGDLLDTRAYAGVVSYEPSELVITARCGTPLADVESLLAQHGQCLPFEPPHFGRGATLGGCVAAGLSGPRRAAVGPLRDFLLGVKLVDGRGRALSFGGQVMKNVAGYDVSRLMAGSLGTLALLAEVSLKVLPLPPHEATLTLEMGESEALNAMNRWAGQPLPISATAWHDGKLTIRLSGAEAGVRAATERIGGTPVEPSHAREFWGSIREHTHAFFAGSEPLWRLAVPSTAPALTLSDRILIEWSGALRWVRSKTELRAVAQKHGGHATLFRAEQKQTDVFSPLSPLVMRIHREVKAAFDPAGIFNPGRMYRDF